MGSFASLAIDRKRVVAGVERSAFRIAEMAVRDRDDALDIVQGAMLRLARSYGARPSAEWKPLFYRILYNGIRDSQRRRKVRSRIFGFFPGQRLEKALAELPARQQEAFALRCLEGMDVAETAIAMGCSAVSVKTHYFRALHTLRERPGEVW